MIENRRGLDIFSHVMLIIGVLVVLFPLYVAFVAATLDDKQVFQVPMTLVPGGHLWENIRNIWQGRRGQPQGAVLAAAAQQRDHGAGDHLRQNCGVGAVGLRHRVLPLSAAQPVLLADFSSP